MFKQREGFCFVELSDDKWSFFVYRGGSGAREEGESLLLHVSAPVWVGCRVRDVGIRA